MQDRYEWREIINKSELDNASTAFDSFSTLKFRSRLQNSDIDLKFQSRLQKSDIDLKITIF